MVDLFACHVHDALIVYIAVQISARWRRGEDAEKQEDAKDW